MLDTKQYGEPESNTTPEHRYSSAACTGATKTMIEGNPDTVHVSTSCAECLRYGSPHRGFRISIIP